MAEPLTTIIAVRDFLKAQELNNRYVAQRFEQFALDWIEEEVDRAESYLEAAEIRIDDETFVPAIHYRAANILEILKRTANCYEFFEELSVRTKLSHSAVQ